MKDKQMSCQPSEALRSDSEPSTRRILTTKELNVLELVSYGYDNRSIAEHFQTTQQAVKNMLRTAHLKLGADNRAHAVAVCFRNGWFSGGGKSPSPEAQASESAYTSVTGLARDQPRYTRHWNSDGAIDSVCSACGLTIARAFNASHLALPESRHECQVLERRRAIRIVSRNGVCQDDRRNARSSSGS